MNETSISAETMLPLLRGLGVVFRMLIRETVIC
jgi:hypothetical protein